MKTKVDILSNYSKRVYALSGEEIEIISYDHRPTLIAKNKKGELFPVNEEKIFLTA